jgi:hypothetical protein
VNTFRAHIFPLALVLVSLVAGCDAVSPSYDRSLVVEAWFDTAAPMPPVRISTTRSLTDALIPEPAPPGTQLKVVIDDRVITYERSPDTPLWFLPVDSGGPATAGALFDVRVDAPESSLRASGMMPPKVTLQDIQVSVPDRPISAVLIDSLNVGLDSLNVAVNATTGYIYPVQVSLTWDDDSFDGWMETRLQPENAFSSSLIDFFLLPSEVFIESSAQNLGNGSLQWEGVYAVPVGSPDSPLPAHSLRVVLRRGDDRFARFITSREAPDRREPVMNVYGGLGFIGGVSTDSIRVDVRQ